MTRSEVFAWMMQKGSATEKQLIHYFGRGVQEVIGSLRDLGLVSCGQNRIGILMWYPVKR